VLVLPAPPIFGDVAWASVLLIATVKAPIVDDHTGADCRRRYFEPRANSPHVWFTRIHL
jgi:hypothetical protein